MFRYFMELLIAIWLVVIMFGAASIFVSSFFFEDTQPATLIRNGLGLILSPMVLAGIWTGVREYIRRRRRDEYHS